MEDSRTSGKRKRAEEEISEMRLYKKFEALESRLMNLWSTSDSDPEKIKEVLEPLESGVTDIVSFVDINLNNGDNLDNEEEEYFDDEDVNEVGNIDEYVDTTIIEVPYQRPPIEEICLSDEESPKACKESEHPEEEDKKNQDIILLHEEPRAEDDLMRPHKICLHPNIKETWKVWTRCGIPLKDKRELLEKYTPPKVLKSPEINEEILVTLHKRPIDRDKYMRTSQDLLGSALTALGSTMSTLLADRDGTNRQKVINGLNDTGKLLTELYHFETDKRRSQIISWKSKPLRPILADTKPDEFLFGNGLKSKINEAEQLGIITPLKPYEYKKRNNYSNNFQRRSFPSPYHWYGRKENEEEKEDEHNFVLNPLKQEPKLICKKEEFPVIKLE